MTTIRQLSLDPNFPEAALPAAVSEFIATCYPDISLGDLITNASDAGLAPLVSKLPHRDANTYGLSLKVRGISIPFVMKISRDALFANIDTARQSPACPPAQQGKSADSVHLLPVGTLAWALITPAGNIRYWSRNRAAVDAHHAQCPNETLVPIIGTAVATTITANQKGQA